MHKNKLTKQNSQGEWIIFLFVLLVLNKMPIFEYAV